MKLTTIFNSNKASAEHQSLIGASVAEEVKRAETLSPRDRALEHWESKMDQGRPIAHQIAALSGLPTAINA